MCGKERKEERGRNVRVPIKKMCPNSRVSLLFFFSIFLKYGGALSMRQTEKHSETYSGEGEQTEEGNGRGGGG